MQVIKSTGNLPLISVVITTYNYGTFLSRAIQSVINQTYGNVEIIVVDDGSTDNTSSVVNGFSHIKYLYQENRGLSAARNKGLEQSGGDYIVFLDADDWLEKDALEQNYLVIKDRIDIAFVSGNYYFIRAESKECLAISVTVTDNHYLKLLQSNYIGMHAAVMFRRWVFCEVRYDETLKACEDYDVYLAIARKYPIVHHSKFIATYYFHATGLSHNYQLMMDAIVTVIKKQESFLRSPQEREAYFEGLQQWKEYYALLQQKNDSCCPSGKIS